MDRSFSDNILVVPNKINLLPHIAQKPVHVSLTQIISAVEPIRPENANWKMHGVAFSVGVQGVDVRGAIVPFEVVGELPQLALDYVEVAAVGPVVPEIHHLQGSLAVVHEEDRVELVGPRRRCRVVGGGLYRRHHRRQRQIEWRHKEEEEEEKRHGHGHGWTCRGH